MDHEIHWIVSFEKVAPFALRVHFADGISHVIDFGPVLKGKLYGPLQDSALLDRVQIDPEVHTLFFFVRPAEEIEPRRLLDANGPHLCRLHAPRRENGGQPSCHFGSM